MTTEANWRLVLVTQVRENYAAHQHGEDEGVQPYWKCKGGTEYLVASISLEEAVKGQEYLEQTYIIPAQAKVRRYDWYYEEWPIDWSLLAPRELTYDEKLQQEYDGRITYPPSPLPA